MELSNYNKALLEAYRKGYRITPQGETLNPKGKIISGVINIDRKGHKSRKHNFRINSKNVAFKAHRLQAYQKFGNEIFQKGIVVRHLNDNSVDNSWDNIEIGTQSDNMKDYIRNKKCTIINAKPSHHSDIT